MSLAATQKISLDKASCNNSIGKVEEACNVTTSDNLKADVRFLVHTFHH